MSDPSSPKFAALAERVLTNRTCGHIVFVDNVAAHRWVQRVLVEQPEHRAAIGAVQRGLDLRRVIEVDMDAEQDAKYALSIQPHTLQSHLKGWVSWGSTGASTSTSTGASKDVSDHLLSTS